MQFNLIRSTLSAHAEDPYFTVTLTLQVLVFFPFFTLHDMVVVPAFLPLILAEAPDPLTDAIPLLEDLQL